MSVRIIDSAECYLRAHFYEGIAEWLDESGRGHHARITQDSGFIEETTNWHSGVDFFKEDRNLGGPRLQAGIAGNRLTQINHHPGFDIGPNDSFTIMTVNAMTNSPTGVNTIFVKREFSGTDPGIEFKFTTSPVFMGLRLQLWDDDNHFMSVGDSTINVAIEDQIHTFYAKLDRDTDRMSVGVDGEQVGPDASSSILTASLANQDRIEMWRDTAFSTDWYTFAFWRRALTPDEIRQATQEMRDQNWSVGWQHPEGYLDNLRATQSASDPVPDPGYGVLTEEYEYPVAAALLSYAPAYMGTDPILRDLANAFGEELAFFRATMDRVLDNHFIIQSRRALGGLRFLDDIGSAHFDESVSLSYPEKYESGDMLSRIQPRSTMLELVRNFQDMISYPVELVVNFADPVTVDVTTYGRWRGGSFSIDEVKGLFELALPVHVGIGTYTHESPEITQRHWRGRNDDGSETTATWKADEDLIWTQAVDENFRIRWQVYNENGGGESPLLNSEWQIQYRLNRKNADGSYDLPRAEIDPTYSQGDGKDDGWRNVDDDAGTFVRATLSSEYVGLADTTRQLTDLSGGSYITDNDGLIETSGLSGYRFGTSGKLDFDESINDDFVELEAVMEINTGSGTLWASGDYVDFRLARRLTVIGGNGEIIPYYFRMRGLFISYAGLFIA